MARLSYTTPTLVYTSIVDRLIASIPMANPTTCFLSLNPDIRPPMPGRFFYVVSLPPGSVDLPNFEGGGNEFIELRQIFTVSINSTVMLDKPQTDVEFLTHQTLGILTEWLRVLNALSNHELLDSSSNEILAEPMRPTEIALEKRTREIGSMQCGFEVCYDVDLSSVQ